jgi:multifunctional beta-oxidation protein
MTKSILSGDVAKMFDPAHVAPLLTTLCSHLTPSTANGGLYEVGSGWFGQTRWEMLHSTTKAPLDTATGKEIAALLSGLKASTKSYPVSRKDHTQILSGQENSSLVSQQLRIALLRRTALANCN